MKNVSALLLVLVLIVIVLPAGIARGCRSQPSNVPPELDREPIASSAGGLILTVYNHHAGVMAEMLLEEYVAGVVAAEMPASFEMEALKAQAIVARTYAVSRMRSFGGMGCEKHPGADICTDFNYCQAWLSEGQVLDLWPPGQAAGYFNKIRQAVRETAGKVITYNGQFIEAVFHAHCGGRTENSEDVWVSARPYLKSVKCNYCDNTRWSQTTHIFSMEELTQAVMSHLSAAPVLSGRPLPHQEVRTAGGRIRQLTVAGRIISGRDLRAALGLPSTNFTWIRDGEQVIFTVRGFGHGVGLCQYGAGGMAEIGKTHEEIIKYYYWGVMVTTLGTGV